MSRGRLLVVALSLAIHLGINRSEAFFLDGARLCPSSGESGRDTAIFCQPEPPTSEPLCSGSRSNCRKVYRYKSRHPVSSLSLNQSRVGLVRRRARNMAQMRRKKRRFLLLERFGSTKILRMGADFRNDRHAPAPSADEHATRATPSPTLRVETSRTRSVLMAAGTTSESKGMALAMSASRLCMNTTAEAPTSSGWDEPRLQQRRSRAECLPLSGRRREISGLWWPVFSPKKILKEMSSVEELSRFVDDEKWCLQDLSVVTWRGDGVQCSATGVAGRGVDTAPVLHPTVRAVLKRAVMGTSPSRHGDGRRIGLAIEGGGMRGSIAAGMASCLHFLGLADSFDSVYGASAGSLVGAYFVSRQVNGTAVYHDVLPAAGNRFVDMTQFPRALGFELPWTWPRKGVRGNNDKGDSGVDCKDGRGMASTCRSSGSGSGPEDTAECARVIRLDFLLGDVVERLHGLDFRTFRANDRLQPLHVVASGVSSMESVSLASRRGHFSTLDELTACIRASMLVPGLAGPLRPVLWGNSDGSSLLQQQQQQQQQRLPLEAQAAGKVEASRKEAWGEGVWRQSRRPGSLLETSEDGPDRKGAVASELLVDAMVFEPLPYRSAVEDGCTDVVVLCTRPKGSQVLGKKPSIYETRIVKRYFERHGDKGVASEISEHLQQMRHLRTYAEDMLVLGDGSRTGLPQALPKGGAGKGREAFVVAVAPDASCEEVGQLEMDREKILQGCRDGFAACYDLFAGPAAASAFSRETASEEAVGSDGDPSGTPTIRSGREVALEFFPDSILSDFTDLDGDFFQPGRLIGEQA